MRGMRAHWSSRLAFILAASGSAVGLGNMWKFPYITGVNGGGAFVLIYLGCIALVGLPIFIAELYIGQQGQHNVVQSFEEVDRKGTPWRFVGWMGLLSAVFILSFYSVVGGWILEFQYLAMKGEFQKQALEELSGLFDGLIASPERQIMWHSIFMVLVFGICAGGVKSGLERWNKILMPSLICLLLGSLVYATSFSGFDRAIEFLFSWNTSQLTPEGVLEAVGHSFFTLSLGMGAIITYGSYLDKKESLVKTAIAVAFLDTAVALLAGVLIFSVVFTFDGIEPGQGAGLMFSTLPPLLAQLPGAYFVSLAFFSLVAFAALTSAVSLLEVIVAYWEERFKMARWKACALWAGVIYVFGLLSALSYNSLSSISIFGLSILDFLDQLTSRYMLPIGGMLIALFFGFRIGKKAVKKIFGDGDVRGSVLLFLSRFLAPLAVALIVVNFVYQSLKPEVPTAVEPESQQEESIEAQESP